MIKQWIGAALALLVVAVSLTGCHSTQQSQLTQLEQVQKRDKIIAGVKFDSKPFGFLSLDGQLQGYDIDLIRELAKRILGSEEKVVFKQVLSSTRVIALNAGHVDLVAATMSVTPEREEVIDFSEPYFIAGQGIVVPKGSSIQSKADLPEKIVLFALGASSAPQLKQAVPSVQLKGFKSSTEAFSALKAGRGDAMTSDDTILSGLIAKDCSFRMLDERIADEPYGLGFRQSDDTQTFQAAINKTLKAMKADGTLAKLRSKWMALLEQDCTVK